MCSPFLLCLVIEQKNAYLRFGSFLTVKYDFSANTLKGTLYFRTGSRYYKLNSLEKFIVKTFWQTNYGWLRRISLWEKAIESFLFILWLLQKTIESFDWRDERRLRWKSSSNKCLQNYITLTLTSHSVVDIIFPALISNNKKF